VNKNLRACVEIVTEHLEENDRPMAGTVLELWAEYEKTKIERDEAKAALCDLDSRKFDDANNMIHVDVPHNKPTEVWLDWEPVRRFIAAALERLEVKDE